MLKFVSAAVLLAILSTLSACAAPPAPSKPAGPYGSPDDQRQRAGKAVDELDRNVGGMR